MLTAIKALYYTLNLAGYVIDYMVAARLFGCKLQQKSVKLLL